MTELVVSSKCIDEPGYGEFLTQIAIVIEDCAKSGMRWTAVFLRRLINRSIKHILCHKIQNQCYNITGWNPKKAYASATNCGNKRAVISECEKEYLVEIRRIIGRIDEKRGLTIDHDKKKELKGTIELLKPNSFIQNP
ncbi:hypothetical protein DINM_005800 [Dirofilaria immitis]|nr:hypothetical protein [Dirofilaria immitis]